MTFSIKTVGVEKLETELLRLNSVRFDTVQKKQLVQMLNRARSGWTPVDTGELRQSSMVDNDEMGYTKDYAPHVEFGHRMKNGKFVQGKHFLFDNVEIQRDIYVNDLLKAIKKG